MLKKDNQKFHVVFSFRKMLRRAKRRTWKRNGGEERSHHLTFNKNKFDQNLAKKCCKKALKITTKLHKNICGKNQLFLFKALNVMITLFLKAGRLGLSLVQHMFFLLYTSTFPVKLSMNLQIWKICYRATDHEHLWREESKIVW